ncbi:Lst4p SCDLUD_003962 [Saccharomycodes ludwigii]|uniref:Lst4p n=1 Tax=Saccharomycodes ludwigii TaxID=36035 RepID=UPI001E89C987|nr:hypothetical protein SCDLUD_003962 [Saccharomycodes ludwigii]KAH3899679.1 hypothetical protein SCDLUD_003962 [Saccharomycodes ludwigii]
MLGRLFNNNHDNKNTQKLSPHANSLYNNNICSLSNPLTSVASGSVCNPLYLDDCDLNTNPDFINMNIIEEIRSSFKNMSDNMKICLYGTKAPIYSTIENDAINSKSTTNVGNNHLRRVNGFRLLIACENGELMSRSNHKIIFDKTVCSSVNNNNNNNNNTSNTINSNTNDNINFNSNISKLISQNELKEYIFGSPVRCGNPRSFASNQLNCNLQTTSNSNISNNDDDEINTLLLQDSDDKLRVIKLPGYEPIILISRTFRINAAQSPQINNNGKSKISISILVSSRYTSSILESWNHGILFWFDCAQQRLSNNINYMNAFNNPNYAAATTTTNNNTNMKSQQYIMDNNIRILNSFIKNFIPLLLSYSEVPRLFLYPYEYKNFIFEWFKQVKNWLEVKEDSNNRLFLLISKILLDYKDLTQTDTYPNNGVHKRITILSHNNIIANKLIFIISALIPNRYSGSISKILSDNNDTSDKPNEKNLSDPSNVKSIDFLKKNSKGWDIPKKNSTFSFSKEQAIIQPSTSFSDGKSIQYVCSSLSSSIGSSSWFGSPNLSRTTSNTSLLQFFGNNTGIMSTPSPSVNEYDEYPWNSPASTRSLHSSFCPEDDQYVQATNNFNGSVNTSNNNNGEVKFENIQRSSSRLHDYKNLQSSIDSAFDAIILNQEDVDIDSENNKYFVIPGTDTHSDVLDVSMYVNNNTPLADNSKYSYNKREIPYRLTAYSHSYNPNFHLQAIPLNKYSEQQIIKTMKLDLKLDSLQYSKNRQSRQRVKASFPTFITSKSLIISLPTRDVKEFLLEKKLTSVDSPQHQLQKGSIIKQKTIKLSHSNSKFNTVRNQDLQNMVNHVENCINKGLCFVTQYNTMRSNDHKNSDTVNTNNDDKFSRERRSYNITNTNRNSFIHVTPPPPPPLPEDLSESEMNRRILEIFYQLINI